MKKIGGSEGFEPCREDAHPVQRALPDMHLRYESHTFYFKYKLMILNNSKKFGVGEGFERGVRYLYKYLCGALQYLYKHQQVQRQNTI
jgi:hypothetical protein